METLRMLEPQTYKMLTKDLEAAAKPLRDYVAAGFPDKPMAQWTLYGRTVKGRKAKDAAGPSFPRYQITKVRSGVKVKIGGRKVRRTNSFPIMRIIQSNAAGQIYDLAGETKTIGRESFISNVNKGGQRSRVMWKRTALAFPKIEGAVMASLHQIEKRFSIEIANQTTKRSNASIRSKSQSRNAMGQFGKFLR